MTHAQEEQKIFWELYKDFLIQNGEPYTIAPEKQWAIINRETPAFYAPCIAMDFLIQKMILRVNVYIQNDLKLYERLLKIRDDLDSEFYPLKPIWCNGSNGNNTRRIKIEIPFYSCNKEEYMRIIKDSVQYVLKFIKAYKPYIDC